MSTKPIIYKYPLDKTGYNPNNLVLGEPHKLPDGQNRAIVPNYGAFFADSLKVRDADSGEYLQPREQFKAVQLYQEATEVTGLEVTAVVVVTDPLVSENIEIDYQAIGGQFSYSVFALRQMVDTLDLDERPVRWGDIIGKPAALPPAPHLHDAGDLYGFEYVVNALEQVYHGIIIGDEASHDEIRQYIHLVEQAIRDMVENLGDALQEHKDDDQNPHSVTKAQVGLGSVEDYPIATEAQARDGSHSQSYMTPLRVSQAIDEIAGDMLQEHTDDKSNPHEVTKGQVGLGSVQNYGIASQAEAENGSSNNRYMTPARTAQAITAQAGQMLQEHIDDTNNPHEVSKDQVGLGSVQNYAVATQSQAVAGDLNNRYMTPLRTAQAIASHSNSGDHDSRYIRRGSATDASLRVNSGRLQAYVNGGWRTVWPAQWS